jgi:hypothetical protein
VKSKFSTDRVFVGQQVKLPQSLTPSSVFTKTEKPAPLRRPVQNCSRLIVQQG